MQRILIVGTSGSGKSTLGGRLSGILGIRHTQLDELHWLDDWDNRGPEEFRKLVDQTTAEDSWIICGNYSRIQDLTLGRADTVIWLDYSFARNFSQVLKRSLKRMVYPEKLWGTNCQETFTRCFLSRDSILLWMIQTYHKNRDKYLEMKGELKGGPLKFIHLKTPEETETLVKECIDNRSYEDRPRDINC